jgi:hypothetical protein
VGALSCPALEQPASTAAAASRTSGAAPRAPGRGRHHCPHAARGAPGDSILDNAAYVRGGPDVVAQLGALLPPGWRATLAAVDGAVIAGVARQLARVPADATHVVVSAGGQRRARPRRHPRPARVVERRGPRPARRRGGVVRARLPRAPPRRPRARAPGHPLHDLQRQPRPAGPAARTVALAVFNDAIHRLAVEHALAVIELRLVCTEPTDYANPIEPSVQGGAKIARAIVRALAGAG